MAKVIIYPQDHEMTALNDLAQTEYRAPKAQAALIIRRELERQGLIVIRPRMGRQSKLAAKYPRLITLLIIACLFKAAWKEARA